MVKFQDPALFLKGTCNILLSDTSTGNVLYQTSNSQTNNATPSITAGEIRAGLSNGIVAVISSDSALNITLTAADFSMTAKAAQVGSSVQYGAVAPACQVVTASGTSLTVDVAGGAPVAQYGYTTPFCYVLEVGAANSVQAQGTAYPINAETGVVSDFIAQSGKSYKVWYFVNRANGQVVNVPSNIQPGVYHYTAQMAVYAKQGTSADQSSRVGWFYLVIPYLKLSASSGVTGDQTTPDTTDLSGMALSADELVESGTCTDCTSGNYAYYVYIPDNTSEGINGLAVVGGVVDVATSGTAQIPVKYVMLDGSLVQPNYAELAYTLEGEPSGTTVSETGVITGGSTAGDCEVTISYPAEGEAQFTCVANVSVTQA